MQYKRFSDFADEPPILDGNKMKIKEILNKEILVTGFQINPSKFDHTDNCLTLQFKLDEENHVIFSGSQVLIDQIEKYQDKIPFLTTIKKINKYFAFS